MKQVSYQPVINKVANTVIKSVTKSLMNESSEEDLMTIACNNMIKQQLRTNKISDDRIIELYQQIPRDEFVPARYRALAYADAQISLGNGQCMFTPLEEASILQALNFTGHETVLEIGTGSGFLTALLSQLAHHVLSVEYFQEFTEAARTRLNAHDCKNVELITADGISGYVDKAPYDCIILSAAIPSITEDLKLQLLPGGRLFTIIGSSPIMQARCYQLDHDNHWSNQIIFETNIPAFLTQHPKKSFVF